MHASRAAPLLLVALAACGSKRAPPQTPAPAPTATTTAATAVSTPTPMPHLHDPSHGYVAPYANAGRTSRVRYPVFLPARLVAVAPIKPVPRPGFAPRVVMTSPGGDHVILDRQSSALLFDRDGQTQGALNKVGDGGYALREDGFVSSSTFFPWTPPYRPYINATRDEATWEKIWAIYFTDGVLIDVVQLPRERFRPVAHILVTAQRLLPEPDLQEGAAFSLLWTDKIEGYGCAAVGSDGRVAVAMEDGRLVVYAPFFDPEPVGTGSGHRALDARLLDVPYDLAALDDGGYATVSMTDPFAGLAVSAGIDPEALHRERLASARDAQHAWKTRLVRLDARGRRLWEADTYITARQPPIDGGGRRIFLAGDGLAAIEDGKIVWQKAMTGLALATAFEDGSLAVACGATLEIRGRDGEVLRELAAAAGETFATPPAIASDGSIWVATDRALYVAR